MPIHPLDDRVIIRPFAADDVTPGGIVLPDTAKEKPQKGEVIAIGPGRLFDNGMRAEPTVFPGNKVIFGRYAGTEIKIEGIAHQIIRESEILAVLDE